MMKKTFYRCSCFFRTNIYLEHAGAHVRYTDDEQFRQDYQHLVSPQCNMEQLLSSVQKEIHRRENLDAEARRRKDQIRREYRPLHPEIYQFQSSFLSEQFKEICSQMTKTHPSIHNRSNGIFIMPIFTLDFCRQLIEELKHFEASPMPKGRPNTMNHYGVLLDELGLTDFIDRFRLDYLNPLARLLFGDEYLGETGLDSHKAFVVSYKMGEDIDLSYHYDNAEITLNVSLGEQFEGGDLYFGAMAKANRRVASNFTFIEHQPSYGILHRGQHLHGSDAITAGERYNLIIWMRSSSIRNQLCPMCWQKPSCLIPVDAESYGDGMTSSEGEINE